MELTSRAVKEIAGIASIVGCLVGFAGTKLYDLHHQQKIEATYMRREMRTEKIASPKEVVLAEIRYEHTNIHNVSQTYEGPAACVRVGESMPSPQSKYHCFVPADDSPQGTFPVLLTYLNGRTLEMFSKEDTSSF